MGFNEASVIVPAIVTFLIFFLGQVTLPRQMEKLEKLIDLFHIYRSIESPRRKMTLENLSRKETKTKSAAIAVAISEQLLNVYVIATLGLRTLTLLASLSLMGLAGLIFLVRFLVIASVGWLGWLDNILGDIVAIVLAELIVVGCNHFYISRRKKKIEGKAAKIGSDIAQYLEEGSYSLHRKLAEPETRECGRFGMKGLRNGKITRFFPL